MTEWTSISVTEGQKEILEEHKPEGMAMGAFIVNVVEEYNDPITLNNAEEIAEYLEGSIGVENPQASPEGYEAAMKANREEILNRLDDLQSQLPNDVAGELR